MNEQMQDRLVKLEKLRGLGVDPYGGRFTDVTQNAELRRRGDELRLEPGQICETPDGRARSAGRVVLLRDTGKLIFLTVRDWTGDIQWALSKKDVSEGWEAAKLLDLGDIAGADGRLGRTKTGELTLWVTRFRPLSKALRPPPEKWHGLTDVEARYRRRYVDLFSNPESQRAFVLRARIIDYAREVLKRRGFIEVETPVLQPIYGGAAARPFTTHHNTLDMKLYLRISPELYLKRCLVGGLERVFEFARCFRNEGISPRHNPEFTMLELYQAYGDYHDMMDITEEIIAGAAREVIGSYRIPYGERVIDYTPPWPRRKYAELVREYAGVDISDPDSVLAKARQVGLLARLARKHAAVEHGAAPSKVGAPGMEQQPAPEADHVLLVNALFEELVEHHLINPTFVIDYPAPLCPLTKRHPEDANLALRFEAYVNAMEMGNAYSELNDPAIQRANFEEQVAGEGEETMRVKDDDFVEALEYGMPPAGGLGIGIDRLCMLLTGNQSIRDVLLFPLQRAERQRAEA
jgi:lysyl-tRNA synthetase class 2